MQNSSDRQREVIYNITYMHLAFCLCRGIACIYKNLAVAWSVDCFPGVGEEKSCAGHGEMSNLLLPLHARALLSGGHPPPLQHQCLVGSGRTRSDGSLGSAGGQGRAALAVDKLPQGSLKWTRLDLG